MRRARKRRLVLIGLDSAVPGFVERFVKEGNMPAMESLMKRGAWGSAMPNLPTHTPTNWTTIATGADPMIHGIVEFKYDSRLRKAEPIWRTAERHGKTSILLRYPGTWPRDLNRGVVFDHGGNQPSMFRVCIAQCYLVGEKVQYVGGQHGTQSSMGVTLRPARGWKDLPPTLPSPSGTLKAPIGILKGPTRGEGRMAGTDVPALQGEISIRTDDDKHELMRLHLLVQGDARRYRTVSVYESKDAGTPLCTLSPGQWSEFIIRPFGLGRRPGSKNAGETPALRAVRAAFRLKLMGLAPDASRMRLHRSEVYPVEGLPGQGFSYPDGITRELTLSCGPHVGTPGRIPLAAGWMDTYFEEAQDQVDWLVRAARRLFQTRDCDIYMMEWHVPDFIAHRFFSYVDPMSDEYSPANAREGWKAFRTAYQLADRLVGGITRGLDDDALVVVVSDHGHCLRHRGVLLENALASEGLFDPDHPAQSKVRLAGKGLRVKADTRGDYDGLRHQAMAIIQSIRDEQTGICPVALALTKEEAPLIGLAPEQVEDVIIAMRAGYDPEGFRGDVPEGHLFVRPGIGKWGTAGGTHGAHHPASTWSLGDIKAFFLMAGPGVRRGLRLPYPIHLRDIAPTACHVIGLPAPANSNGSVISAALTDR